MTEISRYSPREIAEQRRKTNERSIRGALNTYALTEKAFGNNPDLIISQTVGLLDYYAMSSEFTSDPEKLLFSTAVANQLLSEPDLTKQRGLHSIIKLIAIGTTFDGKGETQSSRVKIASQSGNPEGRLFDPEHIDEVVWHEGQPDIIKYSDEWKDPDLSRKAQNSMKRWGRNTALDTVRKNLGITKRKEHDYDVFVLKKTDKQMSNDLGARAISIPDRGRIILPKTYKVSQEHEYGHTQGTIRTGLYELLLRGLDEAHVERSTTKPESYDRERLLLSILEHTIPGFRKAITAAFLGDDDARIAMMQGLVGRYDLDGFLALSRVYIINSDRMNALEKDVYIPTYKALDLLEIKDGVPYYASR